MVEGRIRVGLGRRGRGKMGRGRGKMGIGEIEGVVVIPGWEFERMDCCFVFSVVSFICQTRDLFLFEQFVSFCLEGLAFLSEGFVFVSFFFFFILRGGGIYSLGIFFFQEDFVFLFVVPFIFPLFSHFACFLFVCLLFCLFFLCFPILSGFSQQHLLPSLTGRFNRTSWVTGPQGLGGLGVV